MITVAEHTYEETLLPEKANILDLGCRGFLFTDELRRLSHNVAAVDMDDLQRDDYIRAAVTVSGPVAVPIKRGQDPNATCIGESWVNGKMEYVKTTTIEKLNRLFGVTIWDLIKFDIEGEEYNVIMSLTEPPAKQLSIEFHLHTGIYGDAQVKEMEDKLLSLGYFPVKHDKYPAHGLPANYWDSLFILQA